MKTAGEKVLRVLVIFATNDIGGPGKGLFQLIENIDSSDVEFTVCNFRHPKQVTFEFLKAAKQKGIDIRLITQRWALDPLMVREALEIARTGDFDIVQSHGYKTHILAWIISKKLRLPWVALSHGWTAENLKILAYNAIERAMLRRADMAIGVAPDLYDEAVRLRKGRTCSMILNAIERHEDVSADTRDRVRAELNISSDEFLIGVFGRLSHEKGQDQFIDAFQKLSRKANVKAVLLGSGNALGRLETQSRKAKIEDRVLFLGYQSDIIRFYRAIDLCVLPSRSEGLPNVVLEAQLHERPVIAFDVGGVRETIVDKETGFLVPAGDIEMLAQEIDRAYANRDVLKTVSQNASEALFPKFAVETRCAKFVQAYWQLADSPAAE